MILTYLLFRLFCFPISLMPYSWIRKLGNALGLAAYYLDPKHRKRTLSNLALAKDLNLSNAEIRKLAKTSFQNLAITGLEYPKLAKEKDISKIVECKNSGKSDELIRQGKGVIFFGGHQANWEICFLQETLRNPGVGISRRQRNPFLGEYIIKMQEKYRGKIIFPRNAIKQGLRALKSGKFLGIIGDQGMPDSDYSSLFLGRLAWTSSLPALLSYKTKTPIIVLNTERKNNKYHINYSDPIYPNPEAPRKDDVKRLMDETLDHLQESIKKCPGQWLWQHKRWKQEFFHNLNKDYRYDAVAIFLPEDKELIKKIAIFREYYPNEFITVFVPKSLEKHCIIDAEIIPYRAIDDYLIEDYRFRIVFNFTSDKKINRHYKKLSVSKVVTLDANKHNIALESLLQK